ncbi:MAG: TetR/AcrR family transcriptional regulator [Anaerosomatales bacterium]|nr:TetR/AcrR family transcriptional regulator [Anaerosomatales bacterium]
MTTGQPERGTARDRILLAARELFAERGYESVSITDIAAETGTAPSLVYYHFKDKHELFEMAVIDAATLLERSALEALEGTGTPTERILGFVEAYSGLLGSHPHVMRLLIRSMSDLQGHLPQQVLERTSAIVRRLAETVAQGVDAGEFRDVPSLQAAGALFALINTPITARAIGAPLVDEVGSTAEATGAFMAEVFLRGVAAC